MQNPAATAPCPCGRTHTTGKRTTLLPFAQCCMPILQATQPAADAESLMRSRYTAYTLCDTHWLLQSWHPSTRPADIEAPEPGLQWLGLDVRRAVQTDADHGVVEFVARSKLGGRAHRLHEVSTFVREGGRWLYLRAQD